MEALKLWINIEIICILMIIVHFIITFLWNKLNMFCVGLKKKYNKHHKLPQNWNIDDNKDTDNLFMQITYYEYIIVIVCVVLIPAVFLFLFTENSSYVGSGFIFVHFYLCILGSSKLRNYKYISVKYYYLYLQL